MSRVYEKRGHRNTRGGRESKPNQRLMHYTYWGNLRQVSALGPALYTSVTEGRFVPERTFLARGWIPLFPSFGTVNRRKGYEKRAAPISKRKNDQTIARRKSSIKRWIGHQLANLPSKSCLLCFDRIKPQVQSEN